MFDPPTQSFSISSIREQYTFSNYSNRPRSYKPWLLSSVTKAQRKITRIFLALPLYQRILAIFFTAFVNISLILVFIYNERIFGFLAPYAAKWRDLSGGWLILWILTFITAFPPIFGYSTTLTISGFVFGFPNGWLIVATASVCGSLASFIASRTVLSRYVYRLIAHDHRFEALASTLEHDGLKILCMIRLCPLPFSISNAALSTFPNIRPMSFALATAITSPKLLIHVFIGSRMAAIADLGQNHHLDMKTKTINYISIFGGIILGTTVGWVIYQRTMARARELDITELQGNTFDNISRPVLGLDQCYSDSSESDEEAMIEDEDRAMLDESSQIDEDSNDQHQDSNVQDLVFRK